MGGQLFSSKEILLINGGSRVRAISIPLGIGRVGMFWVAMYLALELAVVAVAEICGKRQ